MKHILNKVFTYLIALVWTVNGLYCKILNFVPRHEAIVAEIISDEYSRILTALIGAFELLMAIWIITGFKSRLNVFVQIVIISLMNLIELAIVPNLLLWGYFNLIYASCFMLIIILNENYFKQKITPIIGNV